MKKLLLLMFMLLSVSSFAQYHLTINSRGDSLFVFEGDTALFVNGHIYYKLKTIEDIKTDSFQMSMYYDVTKIDTTYSHNSRVYPENTVSDADKLAAKSTAFLLCLFGFLVVLMTINLMIEK